MLIEWFPLLLLGLGLGLMHALDADHVMAVSALSNQNPSIRRTLLFSLHWALGHGGVLLTCGLILFGLGVSIPDSFQHIAEMSVGVLLIVLGVSFFWKFRSQKIQLLEHKHDGIVHTHWSVEGHDAKDTAVSTSPAQNNHQTIKTHQPVMVGMLHGLAGSAPALALIPAVASGQLLLAVSYLMIFSLGVILSMLIFGLGFSWIQQYLFQHYQRCFSVCRHTVAISAIGFGSFWLIQAW